MRNNEDIVFVVFCGKASAGRIEAPCGRYGATGLPSVIRPILVTQKQVSKHHVMYTRIRRDFNCSIIFPIVSTSIANDPYVSTVRVGNGRFATVAVTQRVAAKGPRLEFC